MKYSENLNEFHKEIHEKIDQIEQRNRLIKCLNQSEADVFNNEFENKLSSLHVYSSILNVYEWSIKMLKIDIDSYTKCIKNHGFSEYGQKIALAHDELRELIIDSCVSEIDSTILTIKECSLAYTQNFKDALVLIEDCEKLKTDLKNYIESFEEILLSTDYLKED